MAENKKRKRKVGPLQKRARRDIKVAYQPYLDEIDRQREQEEREYGQNTERVGDIYKALQSTLAPLGGQYDTQAQKIAGDLTTQLGSLSGLLKPLSLGDPTLTGQDAAAANAQYTQMAAPEVNANLGAFGALGAGGQTLLASDRSRNLGYQTSTQRQVGLDRNAIEKDFLQDFRDTMDDFRAQRMDLVNRQPGEILARLDQLRQSRKDNRLAQAELELRRSIADDQLKEQRKSRQSANRQGKRQMDFAQDEIDRKQDQRRIGNLRGDVKDLKGNLSDINALIKYYGSFGGPEAQAYADKLQELYGRKKRVKRKVSKKRKRIRSLK